MDIKIAFKTLSNGIMVSQNSNKYADIVNFLLIDENFKSLSTIVAELGYNLEGENGYFYLAKSEKLTKDEVKKFIERHKEIIIAVSILTKVIPSRDIGRILKQTDFITQYNIKANESLQARFKYLFKTSDLKENTENLFELMKKNNVIEKRRGAGKDEYIILNALAYYLRIIDRVN